MVVTLFESLVLHIALDRLTHHGHRIESLEFIGTVNERERRAIRSAMLRLSNQVTFHGPFDSDREQ